jgi:hypothetical protein
MSGAKPLLGVLCAALLLWAAVAPADSEAGEDCALLEPCAAAVESSLEAVAAAGSAPHGIQPESRRCRGPMKLGWEDDDRLHYRQSLGTRVEAPFDGGLGERLADARIDTILDRFAQSGGCVVRFVVLWGATENSDGSFYFEKLERAVARVRRHGFRVLLTLSGAEYECLDSGGAVGLYNPRGRACAQDPAGHVPCGAPPDARTRPTSTDPRPACFARFVAATAAHFRGRGVDLFSLWNEPNHPLFLRGSPAQEAAGILPAGLYRDLYVAGYRAAKRANPRARVLIGELSSGPRRGARLRAGEPRRRVGAPEFLSAVAAPGRRLAADGVAWHPYQHGAPPSRRSTKGFAGVGDTDRVQAAIGRLAAQERLELPAGGRPPLLYTEFGYLVRANPRRPAGQAPDDRTRAAWFAEALQRSAAGGAKLTVLYTGTEYEPSAYPPLRRDDYGIFSKSGRVAGRRSYGSGDRTRRAYCEGILPWARRAGLAVAGEDPATPVREGPPC